MSASTTELPSDATPTGCCPPFTPSSWDGLEVEWRDKLFVKEHVHSLFHIPLDMGRRITRAKAKIDAVGASPRQPLMLSDETSPWGSELYVEVTRPVPHANMIALSGTFLTKVFDGPFRDAPKWAEAMKRRVADAGRELRKLYFAYTTCPACAKAYGHNYVVAFAEVAPRAN
jgi:hypothetical protein